MEDITIHLLSDQQLGMTYTAMFSPKEGWQMGGEAHCLLYFVFWQAWTLAFRLTEIHPEKTGQCAIARHRPATDHLNIFLKSKANYSADKAFQWCSRMILAC